MAFLLYMWCDRYDASAVSRYAKMEAALQPLQTSDSTETETRHEDGALHPEMLPTPLLARQPSLSELLQNA